MLLALLVLAASRGPPGRPRGRPGRSPTAPGSGSRAPPKQTGAERHLAAVRPLLQRPHRSLARLRRTSSRPHPLDGGGAGSFPAYWFRNRPATRSSRARGTASTPRRWASSASSASRSSSPRSPCRSSPPCVAAATRSSPSRSRPTPPSSPTPASTGTGSSPASPSSRSSPASPSSSRRARRDGQARVRCRPRSRRPAGRHRRARGALGLPRPRLRAARSGPRSRTGRAAGPSPPTRPTTAVRFAPWSSAALQQRGRAELGLGQVDDGASATSARRSRRARTTTSSGSTTPASCGQGSRRGLERAVALNPRDQQLPALLTAIVARRSAQARELEPVRKRPRVAVVACRDRTATANGGERCAHSVGTESSRISRHGCDASGPSPPPSSSLDRGSRPGAGAVRRPQSRLRYGLAAGFAAVSRSCSRALGGFGTAVSERRPSVLAAHGRRAGEGRPRDQGAPGEGRAARSDVVFLESRRPSCKAGKVKGDRARPRLADSRRSSSSTESQVDRKSRARSSPGRQGRPHEPRSARQHRARVRDPPRGRRRVRPGSSPSVLLPDRDPAGHLLLHRDRAARERPALQSQFPGSTFGFCPTV